MLNNKPTSIVKFTFIVVSFRAPKKKENSYEIYVNINPDPR